MDCLAGFWDHGVVSMFPSDVSVCTTGTPGMFDKFNQKLNLIGGPDRVQVQEGYKRRQVEGIDRKSYKHNCHVNTVLLLSTSRNVDNNNLKSTRTTIEEQWESAK